MQLKEFPDCCALEVVTGTHALGASDAWSKKEADKLGKLVQSDDYEGATGQVLVITDYEKDRYKRAAALLRKKGWKLLGAVPGAHQYAGNDYQCYLWGSKSFKVPVRKGK